MKQREMWKQKAIELAENNIGSNSSNEEVEAWEN